MIKRLFYLAAFMLAAIPVFVRGDVNSDGNVIITDVTALINYLLSKSW